MRRPPTLALSAKPEPRAGARSSTSASRAQRRNLRRAPRCTWASAPPFGKIEESLSVTGVKALRNVSKRVNLDQCFLPAFAAKTFAHLPFRGRHPHHLLGRIPKRLIWTPRVDGGRFLDPKRLLSVSGLEGTLTIQDIQQALSDAGVEIYRTDERELQIAERVRLHIMDSGVRVVLNGRLVVQFTARTQRSDAPSAHAEELFRRVREEIGEQAGNRGYEESGAEIVEVKDPVNEARVLDVWHEVTYRKPLAAIADAVSEVRWALDLEKYIRP
jgi:hypothetical protein